MQTWIQNQAVDLYIQIEDENGKLSDLKRMELDQDSRPAKKTDSEKKHKASKPKAEDSTVEGLDSPLEFYPDTFYDLRLSVPVPIMRIRKTETLSGCLFTGAHLRIRIPTGSEAPGRSVPRKESTRRELFNLYVFFRKYTCKDSKWQSTDKIQSVQYKFQSAPLSEK